MVVLIKYLTVFLSFLLTIVNAFPARRNINLKNIRFTRSDPFPLALRALHNPQLLGGDILQYGNYEDRNAVSDSYWLWPNAEIPYYIEPALNSHKSLILEAIHQFSEFTCIKFREKTSSDKDFVRIFKGNSCYSTIGKDDYYANMISLGDGCYNAGTIVHELMHTVGFYHEHNRSDRDSFIKIYWDNIDEAYKGEFDILHPSENSILTPFDYNSIMLYGSHSFSKDGMAVTMKPKYSGYSMIEVYDKPGLTETDAMAINLLYKCE